MIPILAGLLLVGVVLLAGSKMRVRKNQHRPEDTAKQLVSRLSTLPGISLNQYCVSGDLSSCLGLDSDRDVLLLCSVDGEDVHLVPVQDVHEVEVAEDGETVARMTRGRLTRQAGPAGAGALGDREPRLFARVRSVDLLLTVGTDRRVLRHNLLTAAAGVDRMDPVYAKAVEVGERWHTLIGQLMHKHARREAAESLPVDATPTYFDRRDVRERLLEALRAEEEAGNGPAAGTS